MITICRTDKRNHAVSWIVERPNLLCRTGLPSRGRVSFRQNGRAVHGDFFGVRATPVAHAGCGYFRRYVEPDLEIALREKTLRRTQGGARI